MDEVVDGVRIHQSTERQKKKDRVNVAYGEQRISYVDNDRSHVYVYSFAQRRGGFTGN